MSLITHLYLARRLGIHGTELTLLHNSSCCGVQINEKESCAMFAVYVRNYNGDAEDDLEILKDLHASSIPEYKKKYGFGMRTLFLHVVHILNLIVYLSLDSAMRIS
jgi:hypothetical protein